MGRTKWVANPVKFDVVVDKHKLADIIELCMDDLMDKKCECGLEIELPTYRDIEIWCSELILEEK